MSEEMNRASETPAESMLETGEKTQPLPIMPRTNVPVPPYTPEPKPAWRILIAPAWFLLGVLVGLAGFAAYTQLTAKPITPPAVQTLDEATVRKAARDGLIEAIQALQAQNSQGNTSQAPQVVDKNAFAIRDANVLGDKNAKVSIIEYADFQCPFCGRHHAQVAPGIVDEYVKTGKASYVFKHLAFLGSESVYAAVASECAADQGKFWEFHDYLFEHQKGENEGAFTKDNLIGFGKGLGLEMTQFEKCVRGDETIARVQTDSQEAQKFGVSSTPTFFVNGKPLVGLTSPDEFKTAIEQALSQ